MKKTDTKTNVLLTDDPALVRAAAAQNRPVVYYERPGAEAVYEADYTVQSLDELDELFFQRVYERHYGLPWCIGETEQLKIRESTEEDVEKLLAFFYIDNNANGRKECYGTDFCVRARHERPRTQRKPVQTKLCML